ncbi:MAG: restriction system protein [Thermomicrobiales bacterium]|nr:restriction system protein [Thermomicrobiales bacterium]
MAAENATAARIPPYDKMLWPTLQAIKDSGNSGSNQEIEDRAIEIAGYNEDQLSVLHGDGPQTEISYRLAWARTYLKAVGALENSSRGIWSITDYGENLTEADMAGIPARVRAMSSRKVRRSQNKETQERQRSEVLAPVPNEPRIFTSTIFEEWRDNLLEVVQSMSPASFEKLCQRVLRESGFTRVEVTGRSGDGGIDGIGVLRIALLSFHVFFQCKRYKGSVGAAAIRDFRGAMVGRTDKGLFITTGSFTPDAKREATRDGAPVLDLIDGDTLGRILKDLNLGVSTRQVEEVSIDADWFTSG